MTVKLTLLTAGSCTHPERLTLRGGSRRPVRFPALFALLEHPRHGPVLYDTGYAPRVYEAMRPFPFPVYARLTPIHVSEGASAAAQLLRRGIEPGAVRHVVLSHFHADHVAGLHDFPEAAFLFLPRAYDAVRGRRGLSALRAGFLPSLLPADFERRAAPVRDEQRTGLPAAYHPFEEAYDLFGDGSVLGIPLPGHAHGQMGLLVQTEARGPVLLAADACWHSRAYRDLRFPHPLANLIQADPGAYRETLRRLHRLHGHNPSLPILPSHCTEVEQAYVEEVGC